MSTKPILFSTPMVQAILDGRKTMTRRVIKPQPDCPYVGFDNWCDSPRNAERLGKIRKTPCAPGDILWVRETWFREDCTPDCAGQEDENECPFNRVGNACYGYKAQYLTGGDDDIKWRPSIHMPKEAARIFLRVTDVRVERVQDITDDDSLSEGIPYDLGFPMDKVYCPRCNGEGLIGSLNARSLGYQEVDCPQCQTAKQRFANLWDSLNAKRGYGWDENPWVWVYSFERVDKPAGWPGGEGGE